MLLLKKLWISHLQIHIHNHTKIRPYLGFKSGSTEGVDQSEDELLIKMVGGREG